MKISEIMTREVELVHPDDTIKTAAEKMRFRDVGFLPVHDGGQVIGVLTDRALVIRAVAEGVDPGRRLSRDWFTQPVVTCYEDQDVEKCSQKYNEV